MELIATTPVEQDARWLIELRQQCETKTQTQVAKELGVTKGLISQAVNNKYTGDLNRIERLVLSVYVGDVVVCPVLGELSLDRCQRYQRERGTTHNPLRVQLYRACKTCHYAEE